MANGKWQMANGRMEHTLRTTQYGTTQQDWGGAMVGERSVASAQPVIRWHGWRPAPFDRRSDEQGGQVFLVFDREGDLALLPTATISYICYVPLRDDVCWPEPGLEPLRVTGSAAITRRCVERAVQELAADGWQVVGRLLATFHGIDTEDDFWERLDCAEGGGDTVTR